MEARVARRTGDLTIGASASYRRGMPTAPVDDGTELTAPTGLLTAGELLSLRQLPRLALAMPGLLQQRGPAISRTVLFAPGYGTSDRSTDLPRAILRRLGHEVHGWGQGRNQGRFGTVLPKLVARVEELAERSGEPVHLIGWSLGGVFVREVARNRPDLVAQLITMGTPVVGGPQHTALRRRFSETTTEKIAAGIEEANARPIRVPLTVIYSKNDGVVAWRACLDRDTAGADHVEVRSTHLGLGLDPDVLTAVQTALLSGGPTVPA